MVRTGGSECVAINAGAVGNETRRYNELLDVERPLWQGICLLNILLQTAPCAYTGGKLPQNENLLDQAWKVPDCYQWMTRNMLEWDRYADSTSSGMQYWDYGSTGWSRCPAEKDFTAT